MALLGSCRPAARLASRFLLQNGGPLRPLQHASKLQLGQPSLLPYLLPMVRHLSSYRFNRHMEFFSAGNNHIPKLPDYNVSCSLRPNEHRPLAILLVWLMSKDSHAKKYANLYNELGFDVLKVRISPFDLLRPTKGSQPVAGKMLEFLHQNPRHSNILVHGFSVGCYLFCEGLVQIERDMARNGPLLNRFIGQIWDSGIDVHGIPEGVPAAITSNKVLRESFRRYLVWFLRTQYTQATVHYERASDLMNDGFLARPALFLYSDADPLSTPASNMAMYNRWVDRGIPVFHKCFQKSGHVAHFQRHRAEYIAEVTAFVQLLGIPDEGKKVAVL